MDHMDQEGEGSDKEFEMDEGEKPSAPKKRRGESGAARKRTTRSMMEQRHGVKTFTTLLQEVWLSEWMIESVATLSMTGSIGSTPSSCALLLDGGRTVTTAFHSTEALLCLWHNGTVRMCETWQKSDVMHRYRCTRCGARFCCQKCYAIHTDTRCLKFMA